MSKDTKIVNFKDVLLEEECGHCPKEWLLSPEEVEEMKKEGGKRIQAYREFSARMDQERKFKSDNEGE